MRDVGDDAGATFTGKANGGFDLGEHGAGFEIAVFSKAGELASRDFV